MKIIFEDQLRRFCHILTWLFAAHAVLWY